MSQVTPSEQLLEICLENINRYLKRQPSETATCLELLQRAFERREDEDWDKAYEILSTVTRIFVRSHRLFPSLTNPEDFVIASISRFWSSVQHRYDRFKSTERFFSFLKMCVNSEIVDSFRAGRKVPDMLAHTDDYVPCSSEEIMEIIRDQIGDDEKLLFLADVFFRWQMKARQIIETYPEKFEDKKEIYNLIFMLRKRLRNHPDLLDCLQNQ